MNNRDRLTHLGIALYGPNWQRAVARALDVDSRQVRRWASGEYTPSDDVIADLVAVARERGAVIDRAIVAVLR